MRLGRILLCFLVILFLGGCSDTIPSAQEKQNDKNAESKFFAEVVALPELLLPEASGVLEEETERVVIDYSNTSDGYVMVKFKEEISKKIKAQVKGPKTTYTYNITDDGWNTFPLSDGDGKYQIVIYENVKDSKYAVISAVEMSVSLRDEFVPFLRPNQYVDYGKAEQTIKTATELAAGKTEELEVVQAVYEFVVRTISYDKELAETVQSGYLPELDKVLERKSGICFDYAALMTGMLRSQGIPCKLVVGYAGEVYHAWISVYTKKNGWINGAIFFDGESWKRMDPTFASGGNQSEAIMKYIGDGNNYTEKYLY